MRKFLAQDLAQFLAQEGRGNKKRFQMNVTFRNEGLFLFQKTLNRGNS